MPALPMLPELNAAINFIGKKKSLFKANDWKFIQDNYRSLKLLASNCEYLYTSLEQLNSKLEQLFKFFEECGVDFTAEDRAKYKADFLAGKSLAGNKKLNEKVIVSGNIKGRARRFSQLRSELLLARARFTNAYDYYLGTFEFLVKNSSQIFTPDIKETLTKELRQQTQAERPFVYYNSVALIKAFDILDKMAAKLGKQKKLFDKLPKNQRDKATEYQQFLTDLETCLDLNYSALVREVIERLKLSIERQDLTFDDTVEGYLSQPRFKSVDVANRALLLRKKAFLTKLPADKEKIFSEREDALFAHIYKLKEQLDAKQADAELLSSVGLLPTQTYETRTVSQTFELVRLIQTNRAKKVLDSLDQNAQEIVKKFLPSEKNSSLVIKLDAKQSIFAPTAVKSIITESRVGKRESYWLTRALSPLVQRYYTEFGFAKAMVPANQSLEQISAFGVNFKNHIQCIDAAEMTLVDMQKAAGSFKNKIRRVLSSVVRGNFSKLCKEYDDFITGQKREITELRKNLAEHIAKNIKLVLTDAKYRNDQNNRPNISREDLQELKRYVLRYKPAKQNASTDEFIASTSFVKHFLDKLNNTNLSADAQNGNNGEDYVTIVDGKKAIDAQKLRVDINNILHFYPRDQKLVEVLNLLSDILISDDYPLIYTQNKNETTERYNALVSQIAYLYILREREKENGWSLDLKQNSKKDKKRKSASNQNDGSALKLLENIATSIVAVQGKQYSSKGASFYQGLVTDSHILDEKRQSAETALNGIKLYYQKFVSNQQTVEEMHRALADLVHLPVSDTTWNKRLLENLYSDSNNIKEFVAYFHQELSAINSLNDEQIKRLVFIARFIKLEPPQDYYLLQAFKCKILNLLLNSNSGDEPNLSKLFNLDQGIVDRVYNANWAHVLTTSPDPGVAAIESKINLSDELSKWIDGLTLAGNDFAKVQTTIQHLYHVINGLRDEPRYPITKQVKFKLAKKLYEKIILSLLEIAGTEQVQSNFANLSEILTNLGQFLLVNNEANISYKPVAFIPNNIETIEMTDIDHLQFEDSPHFSWQNLGSEQVCRAIPPNAIEKEAPVLAILTEYVFNPDILLNVATRYLTYYMRLPVSQIDNRNQKYESDKAYLAKMVGAIQVLFKARGQHETEIIAAINGGNAISTKHLELVNLFTNEKILFAAYYQNLKNLLNNFDQLSDCEEQFKRLYEKLSALKSTVSLNSEQVKELTDSIKKQNLLGNSNYFNFINTYINNPSIKRVAKAKYLLDSMGGIQIVNNKKLDTITRLAISNMEELDINSELVQISQQATEELYIKLLPKPLRDKIDKKRVAPTIEDLESLLLMDNPNLTSGQKRCLYFYCILRHHVYNKINARTDSPEEMYIPSKNELDYILAYYPLDLKQAACSALLNNILSYHQLSSAYFNNALHYIQQFVGANNSLREEDVNSLVEYINNLSLLAERTVVKQATQTFYQEPRVDEQYLLQLCQVIKTANNPNLISALLIKIFKTMEVMPDGFESDKFWDELGKIITPNQVKLLNEVKDQNGSKFCTLFDTWSYSQDKETNDRLSQFYTKEMVEIYYRVRKANKDNSAIRKLFRLYGEGSIKGWAASTSQLQDTHKEIKSSIVSCDIREKNNHKAENLDLQLNSLLGHRASSETKIKTLDALLEHLQVQTAKLKKNESNGEASILRADLNEFLYTANNIWFVLNNYFPEHSKIDYENIEKLAKQYGELPEYLKSSSSIQKPMRRYEALLDPASTESAVKPKSEQESHLSFRKTIAEEIRYLHFEVVSFINNSSAQLTEADFDKVLDQETEELRRKLLAHFEKKNKEKAAEANLSGEWGAKTDKLNEYLVYLKKGVKEYRQYLEVQYKVEAGHEYRGRVMAICSKTMPTILAAIAKLNDQAALKDEVARLCKLVKGIMEFEQKAFKQELSEADAKALQDDFYAIQLAKLLVTHPQLFTGNMDDSIRVIGQLARLLVSAISESEAEVDARANNIQAQVIAGEKDKLISEKIDLRAVDSSTYSFGLEIKLLMLADKFKYSDKQEFQARCSETLKAYLTAGLKEIDDPRLKAKFFAKLYNSLGNNLAEQGYDHISGGPFLQSFRSVFYDYITELPTDGSKQITALIMMLNELNTASTLKLMKRKKLFNDFKVYFERVIKTYLDKRIAECQNFNQLKDLLKLLSPSFKAINLLETGRANLFENPWPQELSEQSYLQNLEALFGIYIEHAELDNASHIFNRNIKNSWYSYLGYELHGGQYTNSLSAEEFKKRLVDLTTLMVKQFANVPGNTQAKVAATVINLFQSLLSNISSPELKVNIIKEFASYLQELENCNVEYDRVVVFNLIEHALKLIAFDSAEMNIPILLNNQDTVKQCMKILQSWANMPDWRDSKNKLKFAINLYYTIKEDSFNISYSNDNDAQADDELADGELASQEISNDILAAIVNIVNSSHGIDTDLLNILKQNNAAHALDILSAMFHDLEMEVQGINPGISDELPGSNGAKKLIVRLVCYTNIITEVLSHGVEINELYDLHKLYETYQALINNITNIKNNLPTQWNSELKAEVIESEEKLITAYAKKLVQLTKDSEDINNLITQFFGPPLTRRMLRASEEKILEQVLKQVGEQASMRKEFVADLALRLVSIARSESNSPDQEKVKIAKQLFIYSNIYLVKPLARDSQHEAEFKQILGDYFKGFITDKSLMNHTAYPAIIENYENIIANIGNGSQNPTSFLSLWIKQAVQTILKQHYAELKTKAQESRSNANLTQFLQFWFAKKEVIEFSELPKVSEFVDSVLGYCTNVINQNEDTLSENSTIREFIDGLLSSDDDSIISGPRLSRRMSITSITSTDSLQSFTDALPEVAALEQSAPNTPPQKTVTRTFSLFGWRTSSGEGRKAAGTSPACATKSVIGSPTDESASHAASFQFSDTRWLLLVVSGEYRRLCESVNNLLLDYFNQINMSDNSDNNKQPISYCESVNMLFSKILKRENCGSNYPGLMLNLQLLKANKALDKVKDDQNHTNDTDLAVLKEAFCNLYFYLIQNPDISAGLQELVLKNLTELANKITDAQEKTLKRSSSWFGKPNNSYTKASSSLTPVTLDNYISNLKTFCKLGAVGRAAWLFTQLQNLDKMLDLTAGPNMKNQLILEGVTLVKGYQIALSSQLNGLSGLKLGDILRVFPLNDGPDSIRENEAIISNYLHNLKILQSIHTGLNKREAGDNDNITTIKQLFDCLNSFYQAMEALAKINKDTGANRVNKIMDRTEKAWKTLNQAIANINYAEAGSEENLSTMPADFSTFMQSLYAAYCEKLETLQQASSQVVTEAVSSRRSSLGSSSS